MKKLITSIILLIILILEIINLDKISDYTSKLIFSTPKVAKLKSNEYKKDYDFLYLKNVDDFIPYSYNDLLNIIYSILNNGWEQFTFYCPNEYETCIQDIVDISNQKVLISEINKFVHPFNSFESWDILYVETGTITINVNKYYSYDDIIKINNKLDELLPTIIKDNMSTKEKLKSIHDYLINNNKYDVERNKNGTSNYKSNTAYGPLFEGYATCEGYADLYAIILDRLNIKNYRITSANHIWNAVYFEDAWLHIDLTWDDPVSDNGKDYLYDTYFLKSTEQIKKADDGLTNHIFDKLVYLEFNN